MNPLKKRFIIVGVILFVFFGSLIAYHYVAEYMMKRYIKNFMMPTVTVNAMTVTPVGWQPTYSTVGSTAAVQGTNVSPIISGMVTQVRFNSGDMVKKDQVLIVMDTDILAAQLASAKAALAYNKVTYERYRTLYHQGVLSEQDFDQAHSNYLESLATVAQDAGQLEQKFILAPFAGRVGIRAVSLGQYLNAGTTVTNIQSIDPIYVNFQVPEQYLQSLYVGQPIDATIDTFPGVTFHGKISAFDAEVADNTKSITVQATLPNHNPKAMILPGMQANIDVILKGAGNVVAIPQEAINYSLYGNSVFVIQPGTNKKGQPDLIANAVAVELGDQEGNLVQVTSGLKAGDNIVTDGLVKLQSGNAVKIITQTAQAAPQSQSHSQS